MKAISLFYKLIYSEKKLININCSFICISFILVFYSQIKLSTSVKHLEKSKRSSSFISQEVEEYLTKFGYLPQSDLETGAQRTEKQLQDAVRNLQFRAGLKITGVIDDNTAELLKSERCGVPDIPSHFRNRRSAGLGNALRRSKRYTLQGQRWPKRGLTWSIMSWPSRTSISRAKLASELQAALRMWARHSQVYFERIDSDKNADIRIYFHKEYHGDGYPFDGPGLVLAHAFFPGTGRGGDVHFDNDERWTGSLKIDEHGSSVFAVAAHEFGHSLGLSHSTVAGSLMYPWYQGLRRDASLPRDDVEAIQALYGKPNHPSLDPETTTRSITTTTRSTTATTPTPEVIVPDICDSDIDALSVIRNEIWIFKSKYFWRIDSENKMTDHPTNIVSFWYALPPTVSYIDALYERSDDTIMFFVGKYFYITSGNTQLISGPSPLTDLGLPQDLEKIDAAMKWGHNQKTYFFSDTMYWRFDEEVQRVELDYPRDMSLWKGIPYNIDAAFQYKDKKTYFFKDKLYWKFNDQKMSAYNDIGTLIGPYWFNCEYNLNNSFYREPTSISCAPRVNVLLNIACFIFSVFFLTNIYRDKMSVF